MSALEHGEVNILHTSTAADVETLTRLRDDGAVNLMVSSDHTEVAYLMINSTKKPFTTRAARLAVAQAIDRKKLNEKANRGLPPIADGAFAPGVPGHLEDPGFPAYDLPAAKAAVAAMEKAGQDTSVRMLTSVSPAAVRQAALQLDMLEAAGFKVTLEVESEADLISRVIGGDFELVAFRNQPGEDPDADHVWWYGKGNPVNFGRFDDPVINENLDRGRTEADADVRRKAYEAVNREFAKQIWNVWLWYTPWTVAESADVHGILGPPLPGNGGPPPPRLVTGHSLLGLWIERN